MNELVPAAVYSAIYVGEDAEGSQALFTSPQGAPILCMGEYGELRQKAHAENTTNLHIAGELGMHVFQARKAEIYFEPNNTDIDEVLSKTYLTMDVCGRRVVSAPLRLFDIDRDEGKLSLKLRIPVNICRHDSFRADFVVAPGLRLEGVNSMLTCVLRGVEVISGA